MSELHRIDVSVPHAELNGHRLAGVRRDGLRIVEHDLAVDRVAERLAGGEAFSVRINQRHKEIAHGGRREVQPQFVAVVGQRLRHGNHFPSPRMQ